MISFQRLEVLLQNIPSKLQVLRLTTSEQSDYFDGNRWRQLLENDLPCLHLFSFKYQDSPFAWWVGELWSYSKFGMKPNWIVQFRMKLADYQCLQLTCTVNSSKWISLLQSIEVKLFHFIFQRNLLEKRGDSDIINHC